MAKLLKLRRGTTTQHSSFTGAEGEVTVDTDKETLVVHDGSTAGGHPVAAEDMANVSSASIAGRLGTDSIATSKIAAGALPTDVTIVNANVTSSAAIAGTKISPDFGSQDIVTTGNLDLSDSTGSGNNRIKLGTGDDLLLYHDGSNSYIKDDGTGDLFIRNGNDDAIRCRTDAAVELYHDNDKKLETSSSGAIVTGSVEVSSTQPAIIFTDTNHDPDYKIQNADGGLIFNDTTNQVNRLVINTDGHIDITGNLDAEGGVDVTGNITVTGTVDGRDVAADGALLDGITNSSTIGEVKSTAVLANGVTATTQGTSDNSTKVATTAYVTTAVNNAEPFPSGTVMLFAQSSAPTGWTKQTSHNNKALRVVSGSASSGGANTFTGTFASRSLTANAGNATAGGNISVSLSNTSAGGNVNSHTLSVNQIPSHTHGKRVTDLGPPNGSNAIRGANVNYGNSMNFNNTGGGGGHSHGFSGSSHNHNANASFSGSAHNHNISVTNLDLEVQYVDVILAAKD